MRHSDPAPEDQTTGLTAELIYTTFEKADVITRSVILKNTAEQPIYLTKVMSACLDLDCTDEKYDTLPCTVPGERTSRGKEKPEHGKQSVGLSEWRILPTRSNPFIAFCQKSNAGYR